MPDILDVVAAIIEKDGRFLIGQRKKGKSLGGKWEFPGGQIEPEETPQKCLEREFSEEFGIKIKVRDFLGESGAEYEKEKRIRLRGYYAEHISGEFTLKDHDKIEWVSPTEFGNYDLAPADIPLAKKVLKSRS